MTRKMGIAGAIFVDTLTISSWKPPHGFQQPESTESPEHMSIE